MSLWVMGVPLNLPRRAEIWTFLGDVQKKGSSMEARRLHIANALSGSQERRLRPTQPLFSEETCTFASVVVVVLGEDSLKQQTAINYRRGFFTTLFLSYNRLLKNKKAEHPPVLKRTKK